MLSIENPPDSSCPCKVSALKSDERASDKLAFQEADPVVLGGEIQSPHFSIRDYVFTSRSKDIGANWPFSQQFLQLCLKHGVKDLLPPFEPPDLVIANCSRKRIESEEPVACSEAEQITAQVDSLDIKEYVGLLDGKPDSSGYQCGLPSDQLISDCSDQAQYPLQEEENLTVNRGVVSDQEEIHSEAEIVSPVTSHDQSKRIPYRIKEPLCSVHVTKSVSETPSELEVARAHPLSEKLEVSCEPSEKRFKLIVKLGTISEPSQPEDIVSNSSAVSDPMASKVCPVCKTFTSTSNTTLNAHIDQCLSVESDAKLVVTLPTHKVKPRKKRLMVDIYTTALHCTLKDLDERNGTNWASDLSLVAPTNGIYTEIKRPKLSPLDIVDDGNEGAVYIDSTGTKLRILSKLNDAPPVMARNEFKLRKHAKDIKAGKSFFMSKQKHLSPKYSKDMKVKPQAKKQRSFKVFKGEIEAAPEGDYHADTHGEKEESLSQILNTRDEAKSNGPATLRQWVCSKRSGLSKKFNNKVSHKSSENLVLANRNPLEESNQLVPGNSSDVRSHVLKFSRSLEDSVPSPKTRSVDILSNTSHTMDDGKRKFSKSPGFSSRWSSESTFLANSLMLKSSRSPGSFVSSPRTKREEIHMGTTQNSDNFPDATPGPSESCHPLLKGEKGSSLKKNVFLERPSFSSGANKGDVSDKYLASKTFRKHRSIGGSVKRGGELPSDFNGRLHGSTIDFSLDSSRANKTSRATQLNLPENVTRSGIEEMIDHVSTSRSELPESEQERIDTTRAKKPKYMKLKSLQSEAECDGPDVATIDTQVKASVCVDPLTKPSIEKAVGGHFSSEAVISEPASNAKLVPCSSLEEYERAICGNESKIELMAPGFFDCQENIQMAGEPESRGEEDSCTVQYTECRTDAAFLQGSSDYLDSHGEMGIEIPKENSSITLSMIISNQDHTLVTDRERSGSPVSTVSTISPQSPEDSKFKDSEAEHLVSPTAVQEKLMSSSSNNFALQSMLSIRGAERTNIERKNQEVKATAVAKEPENILDQPCCCSCRESLSRESQLFRQSVITGPMLPSKGRPSISSSTSGACPSWRTDEMAISTLESPTDSISTRVSSDSVAKFPSCGDFGSASPSPRTPTKSTSNPILRLMGKDLMVGNKEESGKLQKGLPSASDNPSNSTYQSLIRFSSPDSVSNQDSFSYYHYQFPGVSAFVGQLPPKANHQVSLQSPSSFMGAPLQTGLKTKSDQQTQQKKLNRKSDLPLACNSERVGSPHQQRQRYAPSSRAPNPIREVIVIDDFPEDAEPKGTLPSPASPLPPTVSGSNLRPLRPFSCFPSQNSFLPRDISCGQKTSFPISYPMANTNSVKRGSTSEGSGHFLPSSLILPPHSTTGEPKPSFPIPYQTANTNPVKPGSTSEGSGRFLSSSLIHPSRSTGQLTSTLYCSPTLR